MSLAVFHPLVWKMSKQMIDDMTVNNTATITCDTQDTFPPVTNSSATSIEVRSVDGFVDKICLTNHINGVNSTESVDKENISIITDSPSSLRASIILLKDLKGRLLIDELQLLN